MLDVRSEQVKGAGAQAIIEQANLYAEAETMLDEVRALLSGSALNNVKITCRLRFHILAKAKERSECENKRSPAKLTSGFKPIIKTHKRRTKEEILAISDAWLTEKVSQRHITITKYADYLWLLDARGVAYLPACDWLIVSDLHLEKGSYLRSYANPLPSLDSTATLTRLESIIEDYKPLRVISLGDSFHDKHSMSRMTFDDRQHLCRLVDV